MRCGFFLVLAGLALSGCGEKPAPEPALKPAAVFEGLPLSGNLATALAAGFGNCLEDTKGIRCRKDGVTVMGVGPLSAAIDLAGNPARFDHVTLWHPRDQGAVLDIKPALDHAGWHSCLTPDAERLWHPPSPLRIAIDTNYWGSRRLVISAPPPSPTPYC
ncbi:hypothetical protein ASE00_07200 [Sphingomonas sp. Root710]|uniref:hypothetical protein n=1 Tax=Sphingomonas sp. Root710 TaxID=1736594 RepID=UPI0006F3B994|nr:hypothetical protein [Sphingomonas sp. Root710]KRB86477.1 hypothetical protein ASE00_07200 [Sphingomonas sp. Root710]